MEICHGVPTKTTLKIFSNSLNVIMKLGPDDDFFTIWDLVNYITKLIYPIIWKLQQLAIPVPKSANNLLESRKQPEDKYPVKIRIFITFVFNLPNKLVFRPLICFILFGCHPETSL